MKSKESLLIHVILKNTNWKKYLKFTLFIVNQNHSNRVMVNKKEKMIYKLKNQSMISLICIWIIK